LVKGGGGVWGGGGRGRGGGGVGGGKGGGGGGQGVTARASGGCFLPQVGGVQAKTFLVPKCGDSNYQLLRGCVLRVDGRRRRKNREQKDETMSAVETWVGPKALMMQCAMTYPCHRQNA